MHLLLVQLVLTLLVQYWVPSGAAVEAASAVSCGPGALHVIKDFIGCIRDAVSQSALGNPGNQQMSAAPTPG